MHEVVPLRRAEGVDLEELVRTPEDVAELLGDLVELSAVGEGADHAGTMADPSGLLNAPVDDEAGRGQLEHQVGAIAALPPGADAGIFDHGEGVEQYAGARHIANQARALTTKSLLVLRRRKKSTAAYVLMPSLAILALWGVIVGTAAWLDPSNSAAHRDYPLAQLTVRKCEVFDAATNLATGAPCTTAMFAPAGTNTVSIMRKFAAATGLEYGTDVVAASSPQAVADAIAQSPGSVDAAVIFTRPDDTLGDAAWAPAGASGTPTLEYQLWTNTTGNMGRWLTGDDRHLLDQAGVYLPRREICHCRSLFGWNSVLVFWCVFCGC